MTQVTDTLLSEFTLRHLDLPLINLKCSQDSVQVLEVIIIGAAVY
jgi:hypothetical protein